MLNCATVLAIANICADDARPARQLTRMNWPDCEHKMLVTPPTNPSTSATRRAGTTRTTTITPIAAMPAPASINSTSVTGSITK